MEPNKHKFKQLFLVALTLFVVVAGWLGAFVVRTFLPAHYVAEYPLIPFFFFLCGVAFVALAHKGGNMVRAFLALKAAKIAASIVILGLYAWLGSGSLMDFAVTYLIFYVLYMIFEMIALARYQKI